MAVEACLHAVEGKNKNDTFTTVNGFNDLMLEWMIGLIRLKQLVQWSHG